MASRDLGGIELLEAQPATTHFAGNKPAYRKSLPPSLERRHRTRGKRDVGDRSRRPKSVQDDPALLAAEFPPLPTPEQPEGANVIKVGALSKTTFRRNKASRPGSTRYRRFRLTDEALEYLYSFSPFGRAKVKQSFPLVSVGRVDYDGSNDPTRFTLTFSNFTAILRANSVKEANDWVEKIIEACSKWHPTHSSVNNQSLDVPGKLVRAGANPRASTKSRRFSSPVLVARDNLEATSSVSGEKEDKMTAAAKIEDRNFSMMKYPRNDLRFRLPNEKQFRMDIFNMQIMWRRNRNSKFYQSKSLSLHKVVEVRTGQNTERFDKFPYEKVKDRSFSLIYQHEDKRYVYLTSLSLISDHSRDYKLWIDQLQIKVKSQQASSTHPELSCKDDDCTDTTILWLKQIWSCKSEKDELEKNKARKLVKKLNPLASEQYARRIVSYAHYHQIESSYGLSLDLSGLILMFSLIHHTANSRLLSIFKNYAKTSPELGMTLQEFREFLINECCWPREACTRAAVHKLMQCHDSYHHAYKKYIAKNKPSCFVASRKLLSFAGFLSFLRSKDNPAVDPEHETVYQDMTQPLSHYFINSSHNTYLNGDQLTGKSSTDAYVRAFLQGCRCIEIDCWDDTLNVTNLNEREPIIYHGFTLTTKLPFRDVVHAIKVKTAAKRTPEPHGRLRGLISVSPSSTPTNSAPTSPVNTHPPTTMSEVILKKGLEKIAQTNGSYSVSLDSGLDEDPDSLDQNRDPNTQKFSLRSLISRKSLLKEIRRVVSEREKGIDDQELVYRTMVGDLKSLFVYAKATSIKPWDWEKQKVTKVTQMFSFGEPKAVELCTRSNRSMLACTERQLVRTYPKGTRFDSSNYDPLPMWKCGVQMVALNFQYPDIYMHLNQGFFRLNGGCGYVLKPAVMRKEDPGGGHGGSIPFNPEMQVQHPDVPTVDFEIELISGQRLCLWKKKCSSVTVTIQVYGITHDCGDIGEATHHNCLSPDWEEGKHCFKKTLFMPELCLIYFRVETEKKLLAQNCIPVISLKPGIKFIPLRTPGGELIPGSGLFVKIKKTPAVESPSVTTSVTRDVIREEEIEEYSERESDDEDKEELNVTKRKQRFSDKKRKRFSSPASLHHLQSGADSALVPESGSTVQTTSTEDEITYID